jgi:predicted nucleic acid-binding protein
MAEVFKKKGDGNPPLTPEQNGRIMRYFENAWIRWVGVERLIGESANALLVEYGPKGLRPCDAIHLASAIRAECDCLLTWDKRFVSVFKDVLSPPMRVSFPDTIIGPYVPPSLFDGDE